MSTETALWKIVGSMPDSLKLELLHYAEYLLTKSPASQPLKEPKRDENMEITVKKPLAGSMKGTFQLPLPEDFDEPLEDFEDYK